jgi:protocatechuate 3,4-dioxygenase beta subunit
VDVVTVRIVSRPSFFTDPLDREAAARQTVVLEVLNMRRLLHLVVAACCLAGAAAIAQSVHPAPAGAPSSGVLAPAGEPGSRLIVSGEVVSEAGAPIAGASIYAYQTDAEGYYGVKPVSDSNNPRLKVFLRSGPLGQWAFETIHPGSYPNSRNPAHIHFEVSAKGYANRFFEIVFAGDPYITDQMRKDPSFSVRAVRPTVPGQVTERIVLRSQ